MPEPLSLFITRKTLEELLQSRRIDSYGGPKFKRVLEEAAKAAQSTPDVIRTVVDLSDLEYLSSHGIKALVEAFRSERKYRRDLAIVADPKGRVWEVLALAGHTPFYDFYDSPDDIPGKRIDWQPNAELAESLRLGGDILPNVER